MNIRKAILRGWEVLKSKKSDDHGIRHLKLVGDNSFIIDVGIVYPQRNPSILFSFNCDRADLYIPEIALEGFSLSKFEYSENPTYNVSMKLIQQDNDNNDIFITICDDLATFLQQNNQLSGQEKCKELIERIFTWVEFLKSKKSSALSLRQQLGLIAELLVFERLKETSPSIANVVSTWTGPDKSAQDFVNFTYAIEVKCKLNSEGAVKISNLKQLDNTDYDSFLLCIFSLRGDRDSTFTLNSIVQRIVSSIKDVSVLKVFLHKLQLVGYFYRDMNKYETTYLIESIGVYEVADGFPRLVQSNVELGVVNVKYSLNVDSITKYKIDENELTRGWE